MLSHDELEGLIEKAAKEGARKALAEVGLHDEKAGDDIKQLRTLLGAWRSAKHGMVTSVVSTFGRLVAIGLLIWILGALGAKTGWITFTG